MNRRCLVLSLLLVLLVSACTVSYRFNGASIDYMTTKTIQIDNFPIRSAYVWAPMQSIFQNRITEIYTNQTKLRQVKKNGDLQLAGEIVVDGGVAVHIDGACHGRIDDDGCFAVAQSCAEDGELCGGQIATADGHGCAASCREVHGDGEITEGMCVHGITSLEFFYSIT